MTVRKFFFWAHLTAGVLAGLVILIMSVTGVLLMYEKQMVAWADRGYKAAPPAGSARLPIETLLANVRQAKGAAPSTLTVRSDPAEPVMVALGAQGTWYVNPYTGEMLGAQSTGMRNAFRTITDWHRWLATTDSRTTGRAITGASNLAFLFLVCSGLYIWLPRKWKWPNVRAVLLFKGGLSGKARDFNWHNVAGFWCCIPLFVVVLSGVVMSYPWANDMVYQLAGTQPPAQGKDKGKGKGQAKGPGEFREGGRAAEAEVDFAGLDMLLGRAQQYAAQITPEWRSISLQVPTGSRGPVSFAIDAGNGGQPQKRATLTLNRSTGDTERWEPFQNLDAGRRARSWMRFAHTGEYYGIAGQTVAGVASAGGALLVWTGLSLALRRLRARVARKTAGVAQPEREPVSAGG